jgi:uncharacterized protein DUF5679
MRKRIFWLVLVAIAAWFIWTRLRQRRHEYAAPAPQFAPPRPFSQLAPTVPAPAQPAVPAIATGAPYPDPGETSGAAPPASESSVGEVQQPPSLGAAEAIRPESGETAAAEMAEHQSGSEEDTLITEEPASTESHPIAAAGAITTADENERATAEASNVVAPEDAGPLDEEVVGYCVRCKTKRPIKDAHEERTESGRRAARGVCPVCGANMFTFLATNDEQS